MVRLINEVAEHASLKYSEQHDFQKKTADFLSLVEDADFTHADDRLLNKIMEMLPAAYDTVCGALDRVEIEAGRKKTRRGCEWIETNGSVRLKKAVKARVLSSSLGIYR